jgi:arylsulfatase A-like enzyme
MFTSLIPPLHDASFARRTALAPDHLTLAESLQARGYATASWNASGQIHPRFGVAQGFDLYHRVFGHKFASNVAPALAWLDRPDREPVPFFLFLHTYEVHRRYTPRLDLLALFGDYSEWDSLEEIKADVRTRAEAEPRVELEFFLDAYDAEIRSMDEAFGTLIAGLRERGLLERTVVVLTSDHGEEFGERGYNGKHSHTLFDELLRVPLIVRLPGARHAGTRVRDQVGIIDIAPTILGALGHRSPAVFQGRELFDGTGRLRPPGDGFVFSERDEDREERRMISLRGNGWKWIRFRGLFDLEADPAEKRNLRRDTPETRARAHAMRRSAHDWMWARSRPPAPKVGLTSEVAEQLRALGYLE